MKAFTKKQYGGPEVLELAEVERPVIKEGCLLIKIIANSVNPADWRVLRGKPWPSRFVFGLIRPKDKIPGVDFAGIVEQVGENVRRFKAGDKVFGASLGTGVFSEFACVPENICTHMPQGSRFSEMACVPIAGLTALQALVTHGQIKKGESVLINGSSGGVGHFMIQIAKTYGATVTAVCSSRNVDFVKSLGASQVIAYDEENIHHHQGKYDLVIDVNGNLRFKDFRRMGKRGVMVGFTNLSHLFTMLLKKSFSKYPLSHFTAGPNIPDLEMLGRLIQKGSLKVHMDSVYSFEKIPQAIARVETKKVRGKVAVSSQDY